jgi:hypothetical protein
LSGILVAAAFLIPGPTGTAAQQLANFDTRGWEFIGVVDVLILLTAIPFAAYLRSVLEGRAPGTASAAAILFVLGIAVGAGASVVQAIAIGTLSSTYTSASATGVDRAAAVVVADVLNSVVTSLFPIVLVEAGIVGFSAAMVNSRIFPNWVADVGVASAVFAILVLAIPTLAPSIGTTSFVGFLLLLAFLGLLEVWIFASAGYLLRSERRAPVRAPTPA